MYDRHKRVHGLWASEGHLWEISPFPAAGNPVCVYGDPAHPLRIHLQAPYRQGRLTQLMEDYNKAMSEEKSRYRSKQRRKNVILYVLSFEMP